MKNSSSLRIASLTLLTLAGTLFAQDDELIFTSLIAEEEPPAVSAKTPAQGEDEIVFSSLIGQPIEKSKPQEIPKRTLPKPSVSKPQKRLRDPFWPVEYVPDSWKEKIVTVDQDALASVNEQWVAASKKIKVSFTKMMNGQRVASINRKIKKPGDTIDIQHAGKTFQFKLSSVYANGKLGLKKGRVF